MTINVKEKIMSIGILEKVELREIWKNEATDFTGWLENNLSLIHI